MVLTACFLNLMQLVQLWFSRPNGLPIEKLAKHAAYCPNIDGTVVLQISNNQLRRSVPPKNASKIDQNFWGLLCFEFVRYQGKTQMRIRLRQSSVNFRLGAIYSLYCSVVTVEAIARFYLTLGQNCQHWQFDIWSRYIFKLYLSVWMI